VPIIRPANLDEAGVLFDKATLVFLSEQAELADQRTTTLGLQPVMTFRGDTEAEALTRAGEWCAEYADDVSVLGSWYRYVDDGDGCWYEFALVLET
jgi:hypothetical protein